MADNLKAEFEFYKSKQKELVEKYRGRYIVIAGKKILGSYETQEEAVTETVKTHKLGSFLVHFVESGEENYTQTFHSRIINAGNSR